AGNYQVTITNIYGLTNSLATLTVLKATPALTWTNPTPITYGATLSSGQLNASATVPGNFIYSPAAGTVLNAGTNTLTGAFTPTDGADFNSVTDSVNLVVMQAALTATANDALRAVGQTNPVFTGTITGVVNGDNISATYSCAATVASAPGAYPIIPSLVDP